MVLTKIEFPDNKKGIIKKSKFVINGLYPIGFKETNISGSFLFLFGAYQDYQDKYLYLQILFKIENALEYDMVKKHTNYIPNYENDDNHKAVYMQMISKMSDDNLYATDFITHKMNNNSYYESKAIKRMNYSQAEELTLYIPLEVYLRIRIFLENLNVKSNPFPCDIFANPRFNNPEFVNIDIVKRCETTYAANKELYVDTHYELISGPDTYKINYRTFKDNTKKLSNELDQDLFNSQYGTSYYIK